MALGKQLLAILIGFVLVGSAAADPPKLAGGANSVFRRASLRTEDAVSPTARLGKGKNKGKDAAADELGLSLACLTSLSAGYVKGAERLCTLAIRLGGHNPAPYKLRGIVYLVEKSFEQARVDFSEAVNLDSKDPESRIGYSEALQGQGKYKEAIAEIDVAVRLTPDDYRMWNARCWARGKGDFELAKGFADCRKALRLAPGQPEVLNSRGLIYLREGRFSLAERDFTAALRKNPNLATAKYGLGIARLRRGDLRRAQSDILSARELDRYVDDLFFWRPLLSRECLAGVMVNRGWRCRPIKGQPSPPKNVWSRSKTASSR